MRTTISLDDEVAKAADAAALIEQRSFSQLCEMALKEYPPVRSALKVPTKADARAKLLAMAEEVGMDVVAPVVQEMVRKSRKAKGAKGAKAA